MFDIWKHCNSFEEQHYLDNQLFFIIDDIFRISMNGGIEVINSAPNKKEIPKRIQRMAEIIKNNTENYKKHESIKRKYKRKFKLLLQEMEAEIGDEIEDVKFKYNNKKIEYLFWNEKV